ncbi:amidohydrolase [Mesosutterella sp. OilRF-GAM-744-9]|uniref:Amidohydrolase n=1 Tax=Mesosutterella porci TaxID=2915351 RepID=A0ABS9MRX1_9BURK|nr:amidohydrolase [Mesosutterella sp. oilRF-744-WT-GAM-9]MCG5031381.1 amidohydrolase [Mesosutterella sp. oilRF-744-WT-GAM-9]
MALSSYYKQLVDQRRELHQWPEPGWTEFTTTNYLARKLKAWGYEVLLGTKVVKPEACLGRDEKEVQAGLQAAREHGVSEEFLKATEGYTGCVGVLDTGRPGPTMAMRFDIDCIPVQETDDPNHIPNKDGFRSKHNGFMHACGHDCHMSIGLTTAKWIVDNKDSLTGRIKIVFQPAEEGVRGANAVAASGVLDDVDYFLGSHIGMVAKYGEVVIDPWGFLCTTKYDVTYDGKPAHAGVEPNAGRNALAAACAATMQLLGIPRHGSGMTRVNVGILQAGTGRNVIPAHAKLVMEVRGETAAINDYMSEQAMNIIKGCAISYGVKYDVRTMGAACDMKNDPEMVKMLREVAGTIPEVKQITGEANFGGSEDASLLAKRVTEHGGKAAFFVTGADRKAGHHQFNFDVNEPALDVGFRMFTGMVKKICGRK